LKELSLAIITYSRLDIEKYGIYRCIEEPDYKVLLLAYKVDEEDICIVDIYKREKLPKRIIKAINDERVTKYTYGFEYERVIISDFLKLCENNNINNWKSTWYLASYVGLQNTLEGLCELFNVYIPTNSLQYYKKLLDSFACVNLYLNVWDDLKKYCIWMIEAEKQIRDILNELLDCDEASYYENVRLLVANQRVEINRNRLEEKLKLQKNIGINICSKYNILSFNYAKNSNFANYCKFLHINYRLRRVLEYEYKILDWWSKSNNCYRDVNFCEIDLKIPEMLYNVTEVNKDYSLCLLDYRKMKYVIICWLANSVSQHTQSLYSSKITEACMYGSGINGIVERKAINSYSLIKLNQYLNEWNISNSKIIYFWDRLKRAIKFAVLTKGKCECNKLNISGSNKLLIITLPSGRKLVYPNEQNSDIECIFRDIVKGIMSDLVMYTVAYLENFKIDVLAFSKEQILIKVNNEYLSTINIISNTLPIWAKELDSSKILKKYKE